MTETEEAEEEEEDAEEERPAKGHGKSEYKLDDWKLA